MITSDPSFTVNSVDRKITSANVNFCVHVQSCQRGQELFKHLDHIFLPIFCQVNIIRVESNHVEQKTSRSDQITANNDKVWPRCEDYLFNFWLFKIISICSKAYQIYKSRFNILPNTKYTLKKCPKTLKCFTIVAKFYLIWSHCDNDQYEQCDQIGQFLKVLCNHYSFQSSPNIEWLFEPLEKCHYANINCCDKFLGNFCSKLGYF